MESEGQGSREAGALQDTKLTCLHVGVEHVLTNSHALWVLGVWRCVAFEVNS